ncbi:unnamed protein product [Choristocarpus tenellus]
MNTEEEHSNLEKVTDFVHEKELDNERTMNALSSLAAPALNAEEGKDGESVTHTIKWSNEDVKLIIHELEITEGKAETALLHSEGDVVKALRQLVC